MKRLSTLSLFGLLFLSAFSQGTALPPDKIYGKLFFDVQLKAVFPDGKTFVDCTPKSDPADIVAKYTLLAKDSVTKSVLGKFVTDNFTLPASPQSTYQAVKTEPVEEHIRHLWKVLERKPDLSVTGSSLLPLPNSYIVPGGRFREIYYWDSYFTMLGLQESGEWKLIENMVDNFSYLIQTYGHIPNGNRTYYLSRSQPPFFSMMVNLLAEKKGSAVYARYMNSLEKEYDYWMDKTAPTKHVVIMPDGSVLNRYYDQDSIPRQEGYREDYELALNKSQQAGTTDRSQVFSAMCRNLRSTAESGWDFSSRWFADGKNISTIQTTDIVPVDLNGLLYQLELTLAHGYKVAGNTSRYTQFLHKANLRKAALNKYCWNEMGNWYVDYNLAGHRQSTEFTAAGISPLFFNLASKGQALACEKTLMHQFLKGGGVVTTLKNSGQQWDAPNGWAPLQWMAIKGLDNYGYKTSAREIAKRWIKLNVAVYNRTGKLMEKYNVENTSLEAGGGEYEGQDGFGWTNGVLLKLISVYGE